MLQGKDNEYNLNHSVRGEYSAAGSIFIDKRGLDFPNVIIYGHNMGRSSNVMFHDITNFNNIDYFNSITKGYIIYENAVTELNIFAYSLSKSGTDFYKENVSLDFIKNNSINYREPLVEGKLYTLSTCAYDYKDARGILSCIGEEVYEYHN